MTLAAAEVGDLQTVGTTVNEPLLTSQPQRPASALVLAIASVALLTLLLINRIQGYQRLAHILGPRLAGFSRLWMVRANISGRNHEYLAEVTAKYGSLARIGPNHLLTSDEDLIRRINAPRSLYRRSGWYSTFRFKPRTDNLISEVNEEKHDELRRKMAAGYSGKEVPYLEDYVDKHIEKWVEVIRQRYVSTGRELKPMDLGRAAQYFTLDVISDLLSIGPLVIWRLTRINSTISR